jgi:hypothetical protein
VLDLCRRAGLVTLGHVALDGTKVLAHASKHKAMSYGRMGEDERKLEAAVAALLAQAAQVDAAEDAQYGQGRRGDELPAELARRESRLVKIREAKAALEAEAEAARVAAAAHAKLAERQRQAERTGGKPKGRPPQILDPDRAKPAPKAQRNFTDPDSRIMKDGASKSFVQACNAQAAVDGKAQVIVAGAVTQDANDKRQLVPLQTQVTANCGQPPTAASADAGYFSGASGTDTALQGIDLYVPPDRQPHGRPTLTASEPSPPAAAAITQMHAKLQTAAGQACYVLRKAIVEPVFGQIKAGRGFRRFSFRGQAKATAEWLLICLTHNLLKLFRARGCWQEA